MAYFRYHHFTIVKFTPRATSWQGYNNLASLKTMGVSTVLFPKRKNPTEFVENVHARQNNEVSYYNFQ